MVGFKLAAIAALASTVSAQTFRRLGACPDLGCIFPPDQADFLAGQFFDIRLEVHAIVNGTGATPGRLPDQNFTLTISGPGAAAGVAAPQYFNQAEPRLEFWNFTWFEDLFARDAGRPSVVNVSSRAYRRVFLRTPGQYNATLRYNNGSTTVARWTVRDLNKVRRTKNVLFFIGDGMTTNMITAARLIAHRSTNGKYLTTMAMDQFRTLGHQMTHSIDSYLTDSANSAMALYTGHKSTVNALGCYADSSPNRFDDPKVESIAELAQRHLKMAIGIVSTAYLADATPAALTSHTRDRSQSAAIIDTFLNGVANYTWTNFTGVDVLFGGGAENFYPPSLGGATYLNKDMYQEFRNKGYAVVQNNTALGNLGNSSKALGVFSVSNMAKWLDRHIYPANLRGQNNSADGLKTDAVDQPGLKEMTLKAIDILHARGGANGWFLMSEAASIDKMMHALDYDRALGELLELDDTIKASMTKLRNLGILNDTLIVVTADHGHGFDVFGSVDTQYLAAQNNDRDRRKAIGVYEQSGLSQYTSEGNLRYSEGINFPSTWTPRYTLAQGFGAMPDHRENFVVRNTSVRTPAVTANGTQNYYTNPRDGINPTGFNVNGTLSPDQAQGVHSLTDVPVFAGGPCSEIFGGVYNNIDIFYNMANCLGLSGFGL